MHVTVTTNVCPVDKLYQIYRVSLDLSLNTLLIGYSHWKYDSPTKSYHVRRNIRPYANRIFGRRILLEHLSEKVVGLLPVPHRRRGKSVIVMKAYISPFCPTVYVIVLDLSCNSHRKDNERSRCIFQTRLY